MSAQYSPLPATFKRLTTKAILTFCLSLFILSNSLADRTYGPVKAKDFLSKIVNKSYSGSSLAKSQIMVAILRSNPEAFRGGNIHFLRQAVILKLPNESDIATLSKDESSALIAEHLIFFKQGKTGNFVHKALVVDQNQGQNKTENTNQAENADQATNSSQTNTQATSESVPAKVKIEIRKQQQIQGNKLKHVESLEKISTQQNKTLISLDDQIRLLEEQLKLDTERKNKAAAASQSETVNDKLEPAVEQTDTDDEDSTAENAISSLESVLSTPAPKPEEKTELAPKVEEPTASIEEKTETEQPEAGVKPEATDPPISAPAEPSTPTPENEKIKPETVSQEDPVQEVTPLKTNTVEPPKEPVKPQESNVSSNGSTPSESIFSSRLEDPKTIAWLTAAILGLLTLGYLLLGRKAPQKPVATPVPFEKSSYNESADKLSKIPSHENILNPVIKASSPKTVNSDSSSETSSKTSEEDSELKINMARAYMDMGYIDAAKESLEEVQKEGTTEQKDTAQQMLSML